MTDCAMPFTTCTGAEKKMDRYSSTWDAKKRCFRERLGFGPSTAWYQCD